MSPPQLAGPGRRALVVQLVALAAAQVAIAAAAAQALGRTMAAPPSQLELTAAIAAGLAGLTGAALLAERHLAERLAQSLIFDSRAALFEAVIARARGTSEERWLTPFVGDLAALRNWAARGIIRLWTSAIVSMGKALWLAIAFPPPRWRSRRWHLGCCSSCLARCGCAA
jgi:hypothetical protein